MKPRSRMICRDMVQNVVFASASMHESRVLVLNVSFGALNAYTRKQMYDELLAIWNR